MSYSGPYTPPTVPEVAYKRALADPKFVARLWARIAKGDPNECWDWHGKSARGGYGLIRNNYQNFIVPRVVFYLYNGYLPPMVRHFVCDRPCCCNPRHLRGGNAADNARDRVAHKRQRNNCKLTRGQVAKIRHDFAAGKASKRELAARFGVGVGTIRRVIAGNGWKNARGPITPTRRRFVRHVTDDQIQAIKVEYAAGAKQSDLVEKYRISQGSISRIIRGKICTDVPGPTISRRRYTRALTEAQVVQIRELYAHSGVTQKQLGARFGVDNSTVCNIVQGKYFAHLPGPITGCGAGRRPTPR